MEKEKNVILVVEDEAALSRALSIKLASEGFHILSAGNGEEGLKMSLEQKPDLILLDIGMPVMNGISMLKKLREDEWGKTARVIILTNMGDDKTILADALENNVTEYIVKSETSLDQVIQKAKEKLGSA